MADFKPGDLAMLTVPSNFGLTVELISLHQGPCVIRHTSGYSQELPEGSTGWLVRGDNIEAIDAFGRVEYVQELAFRPKWLMPLRGDEQPQEQRHTELTA